MTDRIYGAEVTATLVLIWIMMRDSIPHKYLLQSHPRLSPGQVDQTAVSALLATLSGVESLYASPVISPLRSDRLDKGKPYG